jgi:hypothetical protein
MMLRQLLTSTQHFLKAFDETRFISERERQLEDRVKSGDPLNEAEMAELEQLRAESESKRKQEAEAAGIGK